MGTHGFHWISHGGYSMLSDLKICSACFFLCQTKLNSHCHRFTLCLVLPCLSLSLTLCATGIEHLETIHCQKKKGDISNDSLEGGLISISVHSQCHRFTICFVLPCLSLSLTLCATGIEHLENNTLSKEKGGLSNNSLKGGWICNFCP